MYKFRTMGNAIVQVLKDENTVLTTDPWLTGRAYFDSWALNHPLSEAEIQSVVDSPYIWISHGHPDHLHWDSLALLSPGQKILIPEFYSNEIETELANHGFFVEVMKYREWQEIDTGIEALCIDNINQDGILIVRAGDALLLNLNDSPMCGEYSFIHDIVRNHPNDKIFAFQLCAIAADMMNIVDENEVRITPPAEDYQPGVVGSVARRLEKLGVNNFCCSSSQHIYVRKDTQWLNEYDMTFDVMQKHWASDRVKLHPPFITYDLAAMTFESDWPAMEMDLSQLLDNNGDDDWDEPMSYTDWEKVEAFFEQFETLRRIMDFVEIKVAGESKRYYLGGGRPPKAESRLRGVQFIVPRNSLMETLRWGYFDDLLIGNFMKTHPVNMTLYPDFSPRIAKYGGNAKVYTNKQLRAFYWHYIKRNPIGMLGFFYDSWWSMSMLPRIRNFFEDSRFRPLAKLIYRRVLARN